MAGVCEDYRSWHLENLTDPVKAAYFLMAALEDALEMDVPDHFLKAALDVSKIHGKNSAGVMTFVYSHLKLEDRPFFAELTMRIWDKVMVSKLTAMEPQLI